MEKEAFPMAGGDGPNSYANNSNYQEQGLECVKELLMRSIQENVEIPNNSRSFWIADLGCSVGPNTFLWVQAVIDAVDRKNNTLPELEFQVFFNDHIQNDFNLLFKNLPSDRKYTVAAVPGSFHTRLFPNESMNFMIASFALHWLSKSPDTVTRKGSSAYNKGRITYALSSKEVVNAYSAQFANDMEAFFNARVVELAPGGLLSILTLCREDGAHPSKSIYVTAFEVLGSALIDMVKKGLVEEELVDSFNFPMYCPTPSEVKQAVENCKGLTVEIAEVVYQEYDFPKDYRIAARKMRAITENFISKHFGAQILDELFERYKEKLEELSKIFGELPKPHLFMLVRRSF